MKVTVDTNVLLRAVVQDDREQAGVAARLIQQAEVLAISTACLCEFVWVLRKAYKYQRVDIVDAIEALLAIPTVRVDRTTVEAGLKMLQAGGDFADGVLAHEGRWLGGERFVSFDRKAVSLLQSLGQAAQELA